LPWFQLTALPILGVEVEAAEAAAGEVSKSAPLIEVTLPVGAQSSRLTTALVSGVSAELLLLQERYAGIALTSQ
jgi:hypothetical protein